MGDVLPVYADGFSRHDLRSCSSASDFYLQLWVSLHGLSGTLAFYTVSSALA